MVLVQDVSQLFEPGDTVVTTIDSHTEGEATRLIVDGPGPICGGTMMEKLDCFKTFHDQIRCLLTKEPRGSRQVLAAMVTKNVTPNAAFGLIYMDAKRYPYLCGHATIGAVTSLAQTGALCLAQGDNAVLIDTPAGIMDARARVRNGRVISVAIHMVPSFVFDTCKTLQVEGFGQVSVDLVCTGGFFAMVDAGLLGIDPIMENKAILVDLGMKIIEAANEQLKVVHPVCPDVNTVDVTEFYDSQTKNGRAQGRSLVVYGESHMDRSPCGTGTAAKLALLYHQKKLAMNQPYTNLSPLGTSFEAQLVGKTQIGPFEAMVSRIQGKAWVTGLHYFVVDKTDPFQQGFMV